MVECCPCVFLDLNLLEGKAMQINIVYVHCAPKIISIYNSFENNFEKKLNHIIDSSMIECLVLHADGSYMMFQGAIHFEASHVPGKSEVERVDALVELATAPLRPDGSTGLSAADREEISSVYVEVH